MVCRPCAARAAATPMWQVKDAIGRVVYESASRSTADAVAERYPGGEVAAAPATGPADTAPAP
ncbi:hypothetical protein GCM10010412_092170 [Nonomuraea recticatena]|uniref:Uncharacterized protein n=1 Tax=Nonomuraea recticatena TaxID=46178 RepID=A0ABN3TAF1_9ACTN